MGKSQTENKPQFFGNTFAVGHTKHVKKFKSPDDLYRAILIYFQKCDKATKEVIINGELKTIKRALPYTLEGLGESIGVTRQAVLNYTKKKTHKEFHSVLLWARNIITKNQVEKALLNESSTAFTKFILTNNAGYTEKTEIETNNPVFLLTAGIEIEKSD